MESAWESSRYHMIPSVWAVDGNPSFHWCMETCAAHVCLSLSQVTAQSGKMQKISPSCASQLIPISESRRDPPRGRLQCRESLLGELGSVSSICVCSIWFTGRPLSSDNGTGLLEYLKNGCQIAAKRAKRDWWKVQSVRWLIGWDRPHLTPPHELNFLFSCCFCCCWLLIRCLVRQVVLANRM